MAWHGGVSHKVMVTTLSQNVSEAVTLFSGHTALIYIFNYNYTISHRVD